MSSPIRVVVSGAAGNIGYALVFKLASGQVFGAKQPVELVLLEIEPAVPLLKGLEMELEDCAYPTLVKTIATSDYDVAFKDVDYAILVGAMPRKQGMERSDLLRANVGIFKGQGMALEQHAKRSVKVLVVGNPANTNALVCAHFAPSIPRTNFSALTRLDHNRATSLVARHLNVGVDTVEGIAIWGNHSSTQYPDVSHATSEGKAVLTADTTPFFRGDFVTTVQKRGAAVIAARKSSSAASAAQAICDHVRDWHHGSGGRIVSMAIPSGAYNVPEGVMFSYPVRINERGEVAVVAELTVDEYSRKMLDKTYQELADEWSVANEFVSKI